MRYIPKRWRLWLLVAVVPLVAFAAFVLMPPFDEGPGVNRTSFQKIKKGMSRDEVYAIMGGGPIAFTMSGQATLESWGNWSEDSWITVQFRFDEDEAGPNRFHITAEETHFDLPPFWERVWKSVRSRFSL